MKRLLFLFALLPMLAGAQVPIKNLVMEGAGIRGLAYCGAVQELHTHGKLQALERVAGTSAGSIVACLLSVGYTPDEISTIVGNTDFGAFNDGEFMFMGGTERMLNAYGWYKGDVFLGWLESHVSRKTEDVNLTFEALHQRKMDGKPGYDLYVAATNLSQQKAAVFSHETHPTMRIVDAVRASMSVPFWFEAVCLDDQGHVAEQGQGDVYIDGGVLTNYPLAFFDAPRYYSEVSMDAYDPDFRNPETLGLRMDSPEQVASDNAGQGLATRQIEDIEDYVTALYTLVLEGLNRQDLDEADWARTISIPDTNLGPRVQSLDPSQKEGLLASGRGAVQAHYAEVPGKSGK